MRIRDLINMLEHLDSLKGSHVKNINCIEIEDDEGNAFEITTEIDPPQIKLYLDYDNPTDYSYLQDDIEKQANSNSYTNSTTGVTYRLQDEYASLVEFLRDKFKGTKFQFVTQTVPGTKIGDGCLYLLHDNLSSSSSRGFIDAIYKACYTKLPLSVWNNMTVVYDVFEVIEELSTRG